VRHDRACIWLALCVYASVSFVLVPLCVFHHRRCDCSDESQLYLL